MKSIIAASIVMILTCLSARAIADYCFYVDNNGRKTTIVFKNFKPPNPGECSSAFVMSPDYPGLIGNGAGCTTADGKDQFLFTFSTEYQFVIDLQSGDIDFRLMPNQGHVSECFARAGAPIQCDSFSLIGESCVNVDSRMKSPPNMRLLSGRSLYNSK